jgi:hypothetical protein
MRSWGSALPAIRNEIGLKPGLFCLSLIPGLKTGATEESVRMSVRGVETLLNAREPKQHDGAL